VISEVFLDLDDTLNLFTPAAMKFVGCPVNVFDYKGNPENRGNYDLISRVNFHRAEDEQFELKQFWNSIPRDFWATTPKSPDFDRIIDWCERLVGPENVIILTSPTKDPDCLAGKLEWIHTFLPAHYHRQYIVTPRKQYNAAPGRLIIDDAEVNLAAWKAKGGSAIRVPKPWNEGWELFEEGYDWDYMEERFTHYYNGQLTRRSCVVC
jgi:hypothetical protein